MVNCNVLNLCGQCTVNLQLYIISMSYKLIKRDVFTPAFTKSLNHSRFFA